MPTTIQPSRKALANNSVESGTEQPCKKVPDLAAKPDIAGMLRSISDRREFERFVKGLTIASWRKFHLSLLDHSDLLAWHPKGTVFIRPGTWGYDANGRTASRNLRFVAPCHVQVLEALVVVMCLYLSALGKGARYYYIENVRFCDRNPDVILRIRYIRSITRT